MKRKWSKAQRVKFSETVMRKKNHKKATFRVRKASHFYRLIGGQLVPVHVRRVNLLVVD